MKFKVGDKVKLINGKGPRMVVWKLIPNSHFCVSVVWWCDYQKEFKDKYFPEEALTNDI